MWTASLFFYSFYIWVKIETFNYTQGEGERAIIKLKTQQEEEEEIPRIEVKL